MRSATAAVVERLGHTTALLDEGNDLLLGVDGSWIFSFTANCTWADLWLITAPFLWRFGRPLGRNLVALAAMAAAIFPYNVGRIALALDLQTAGHDWRWIHDVPDLATHLAVMTGVVLLALRADAAVRAETSDEG